MKAPVAACEAVIVAVPVPTTLIVFPEIIATFVFEEVKTHGAGELEVGGTIGTEPTPYVAVIIGKGPRIVKVACAGAIVATREAAIIRTEYVRDNRMNFIFSLSSMFTGFLGCWHPVGRREVSHLISEVNRIVPFSLAPADI